MMMVMMMMMMMSRCFDDKVVLEMMRWREGTPHIERRTRGISS